MAQDSYPRSGHSSGALTYEEYETHVSPNQVDGIVGLPGDTPVVYGDSSGRQVKIRASRFAQVRGFTWSSGSSETTLSIGANSSGQTRVDYVVIGVARSTRIVSCYVKAGTPGAGAPALTQDLTTSTGTYEIPVATVTVVNAATTISAADVVFKGWFTGSSNVTCTSTTRPTSVNGLRIFETDTGYTQIGSAGTWLRLAQETETKRLVWGKRYTNAYLYSNSNAYLQFVATDPIPLKAGHNYEVALDATVFTGNTSSSLPIWVLTRITDGTSSLVDSGCVKLEFQSDSRRICISQVYPVATAATVTFRGFTGKAIGNTGTYDVMSDTTNHACWFRVYDLGTLPLAA